MTASSFAAVGLADGSEIAAALKAAMAGGLPVAPLPTEPNERRQVLEMLQPRQPVPEPDIAAIVATSGSTGKAKGVLLSRSAIQASAEATSRRLGGPGHWVLALPAHYVAGLMVLARCLVGGTSAYPTAPDLSDLPEVVGSLPGRRYISVVPTQLVRALQYPERARALASFDAVLVGGAAVDPLVLDRARTAGVAVVTTYGMSETCGGCVYDGVPLDCAEVSLEPATQRVLMRGAMLFSGYRLRPDLTAAALTGARPTGPGRSSAGLSRPTLRTQDRGQLVAGRLAVLGRVDDVVISGGMNVDLAAVERACRRWLETTGRRGEVAVVGVPDPEWGTRIVAVTDVSGSVVGLRSALLRSLPGYALPRLLVRLDVLPRTSSGKIDRQRLVGAIADVAVAAVPFDQGEPA
ncbi:MAG TPA: AMP-binding protein [Propionibacteriaceae bacterium]|nr:AMP-binding protein [Propionibacteriaceae bacterium]